MSLSSNRRQFLNTAASAAAFAGAACAFLATKFASRFAKMSLSGLLIISFIFLASVYGRRFYQPSAAPLRDAGLKIKYREKQMLLEIKLKMVQ